MPANHGLWLDDDEGASPARPESEEGDPESSIGRCEAGTWAFLGVGRELLTESKLNHHLVAALSEQGRRAREENGCVPDPDEDTNHRGILNARARRIECESCALALAAS